MPPSQCPVLGYGLLSHRWGKKSYPLPSADIFTLQLASIIHLSVNNRICQPCWERHTDHTMRLDGRTRVVPTVSSSPLDALLSALFPLLLSPCPLHLLSLLCPLLLLLQHSLYRASSYRTLTALTSITCPLPRSHLSLASKSPACSRGRGSRMRWQRRRVHRMKARRQRLSSCAVAWTRV